MTRHFVFATAFAALLAGAPASASPAAVDGPAAALARGDLPTGYSQYRRFGHGGYGHRRFGHRHGWRRGYGYRRGPGVGAAVGAGVAGLAAGAIIGGAIASSQAQAAPAGVSAEAVAACARRYRSYDAASGTYLGNDGARRPCP